MPERTIEDIAQDNETNDTVYAERPQEEQFSNKGNSFSLDFLKVATGEGTPSDYQDHPLNFNNSLAMGRVLRGLTGLLGELNFAIADIVIGAFELVQKNKKGKTTENAVYRGTTSVS